MLTHPQLIMLINKFKYPINMRGMCYGVAVLAMQAFLANDMATFKQRIVAIDNAIAELMKNEPNKDFNYYAEKFHCRIQEIETKRQKKTKTLSGGICFSGCAPFF